MNGSDRRGSMPHKGLLRRSQARIPHQIYAERNFDGCGYGLKVYVRWTSTSFLARWIIIFYRARNAEHSYSHIKLMFIKHYRVFSASRSSNYNLIHPAWIFTGLVYVLFFLTPRGGVLAFSPDASAPQAHCGSVAHPLKYFITSGNKGARSSLMTISLSGVHGYK